MDPALHRELSKRGGKAVAKGDRGFSKNRAAAKAAAKSRWTKSSVNKPKETT
jgi:hypothetical protein